MARTCTYLNFSRNTGEAFNFYKPVLGGEFTGGGITRFSEIPAKESAPSLPDNDKNFVKHIELPISGW